MTLFVDTALSRAPQPEVLDVAPLTPAEVGKGILRALDGNEIDLDGLHCGEQVSGFMTVEDRTHFVRITEALRAPSDNSAHTVFMLPGFTEMVDRGTGRNLHDAVARKFVGSRVVSIATDGVGTDCKQLGWRESLELSFNTMASDRLEIAQALAQDSPITMVNVSMGSVIGLKMALQNMQEQRIRIEHIVNHSPAQVPLLRVPRDMLIRFPVHMAIDGLKEAVHHPQEALDSAIGFLAILATHAPSYVSNVKNLIHGTNLADVFRVAEVTPTTFIFGVKDPLIQRKQLARLQQALPDNIYLVPLENKGHACSLDAENAAVAIAAVDTHATA